MEASLGRLLAAALFLLLASTSTLSRAATAPSAPVPSNTEFINSSCNATTYHRLCYRSLSPYANKIKTNPKLLVRTALNVTLGAARSTRRLMKKLAKTHGLKPREAAAVADCVEEMDDCVYELEKSMDELGRVGGSDFWSQMEDIQTWVSAALTDEDTCMDGFEGKAMDGRVKTVVRKRILKISHLTSNALALVNEYASTSKP